MKDTDSRLLTEANQPEGFQRRLSLRFVAEQAMEPSDDHWNRILDERYADDVSVPHHRPVAALKPINPERIAPPHERCRRMVQNGFDFSTLNELYAACGFAEALARLGRPLPNDIQKFLEEETSNEKVADVLGAVNGDPRLDYEAAFSDLDIAAFLDPLKRQMRHLPETETRTFPSLMSVPDILLSATLQILTGSMLPQYVPEFAQVVGHIMNDDIKNPARIKDYARLQELYDTIHPSARSALELRLQTAMRDAHQALIYRGSQPLFSPKNPADVVIPLHGGALSDAAVIARTLVASGAAEFLLPLGGHAPHQTKELGLQKRGPSEMDEILAACCVTEFHHRMPELGSSTLPPAGPRVRPWQIIPTGDRMSNDTSANAKAVTPIIRALRKALDRAVRIQLVTCEQHSARARMEFLKLGHALGPDAVDVRVQSIPDVFVFQNLEQGTKPEGVGNLFGEPTKRLYEVCVA